MAVGLEVPDPTDDDFERVRAALLGAAASLWRELPWRATRDPWLVLVSEVMLQQTQAPRVVDPFTRFVRRFPTPAACAAAGAAEVVRSWAGLGYNRRAVNLHRCALQVVERHQGCVPRHLEELLALPGIGHYTARAVLALAYGQPVGVVDTNVCRVLARAVVGRPLKSAEAQRLADRLVPPSGAWGYHQAMFDLGARHCTARTPRCTTCPITSVCRWATLVRRHRSIAAGAPAPATLCGSAGSCDASDCPVPDPAAAARRRQAAFRGSDRQGRGRLVDALRCSPVPLATLAFAAGWPEDETRALRTAEALVEEGLACWRDGALALA